MNNVVRPALRRFDVIVTHAEGMWTAECDALHLVTEAHTYEALTARAWAIAPELAAENGLGLTAADIHLLFQHEQAAPEQQAL